MREMPGAISELKIQPGQKTEPRPSSPNTGSVNPNAFTHSDALALENVRAELEKQRTKPIDTSANLLTNEEQSLQHTNDIRETATNIASIREKVKTISEPFVSRAKIIGKRCEDSLKAPKEWGNRLSQYFETQVTSLQNEINDRSIEWQSQIYQAVIPAQEIASHILHSGALEISMKYLENALTIQKLLPRLQALPMGGM